MSQVLQVGSRVKIGNIHAKTYFYYPVVGETGTLVGYQKDLYGNKIGEVVMDGASFDASGWQIQLVDLIRLESENNLDSKSLLKKEVEL